MKNKIFGLFGFALLTLLVLTSFASATITFSSVPTLSQTGTSFDVTATSDIAEDDVFLSATQITVDGQTITFTNTTPVDFTALTLTQTITMNYVVDAEFDFDMGQYTSTLTARNTTTSLGTSTLTFAQTNFCAWNENNLTSTTADLEVSIKDIQVIKGFGEENEWYPEDEVEVEVKVENNNNDYDIKNIVLEWGLFNKETNEWTIEVTDENDFDIKDGEEKTITLSIKLDDMDEEFGDLTGDLVFYVRATGEVDDDDGEYDVCASDSEDVSVVIESEFVILSDVQLSETASCGSQVQLTADVWNIGDEKQDDVYVIVYNKDLGLNQKVVIGDIDEFDNEKLDVLVNIPQNAEEKTYTLALWVYNEDDEVYENTNDDESKLDVLLKVEGSCSTTPLVTVTANLESEEVKAGQELIVRATIVNTGSVKKTFNLELSGYDEWATLVSMDKTALELDSKTAGDVIITLKINNDASGEKAFNILAKDGTKVLSQPVTVALESKPSILSAITGLVTGNGKNNWYLWGIGALNVVLVLVIIFVAIKVVKKK